MNQSSYFRKVKNSTPMGNIFIEADDPRPNGGIFPFV